MILPAGSHYTDHEDNDMATAPRQTVDDQVTKEPSDARARGGPGGKPATARETMKQRVKEQAEADKRTDEAAFKRATGGVLDDDMRDKLLALGCDVSRASPATEQPLPDAVPGLTTTTGAHASPIDPTTAAVPMEPDDPKLNRMFKGYPTVGSRKSGTPEKRFQKPQGALADQQAPASETPEVA